MNQMEFNRRQLMALMGSAAVAAGTTEILYTPAGDDLLGQVETFYDAVQSVRD